MQIEVVSIADVISPETALCPGFSWDRVDFLSCS